MSSLDVNNLLHTLRGEQFRHPQNMRGSRSHLSVSSAHNSPTLPLGLIYATQGPVDNNIQITNAPAVNNIPVNEDLQHCAKPLTWRVQALSIVYRHLSTDSSRQGSHTGHHASDSINMQSQATHPPVPTLTHLCLLVLASSFSPQEFAEEIVPFLPPHLRRELLRYTSVHAPLPNSKLYPLYEPSGHADGEFVVIGPHSSFRDDHFPRTHRSAHSRSRHGNPPLENTRSQLSLTEIQAEPESSWDSPAVQDEETFTECHTVAILSCSLSASSLLTLPPTITHLALIDIPSPVPLHHLPSLCPLIVILDLSYNTWMGRGSQVETMLDRVTWNRWDKLRVLGLRGCWIAGVMIDKINDGRWNDIQVIR